MQGADADQGQGEAIDRVFRDFAVAVGRAQGLARRLGYVAMRVEESVEDVSDFHAAVETLLGAAPVTDAARAMRDRLSDADRRLLRDTRAARNELVYDFFINFPLLAPEAAPEATVVARAGDRLADLSAVLDQAGALTARLEASLARDPVPRAG